MRLPSALLSRQSVLRAWATLLAASSVGVVRHQKALADDPLSTTLSSAPSPFDPFALSDNSIDLRNTPRKPTATATARCFLDVSIGGESAGRIEIELYGQVAPRATRQFLSLCKDAERGYAGSNFYRIISELSLQGGEVAGAPSFEHDNYAISHNVEGLVSFVNTAIGGKGSTSDSRFLISLPEDAGFLDGRYEAFGRVPRGMEVVRRIEMVRVRGTKNKPVTPVKIEAAGEIAL